MSKMYTTLENDDFEVDDRPEAKTRVRRKKKPLKRIRTTAPRTVRMNVPKRMNVKGGKDNTGGRVPGSINHNTATLREAVLMAATLSGQNLKGRAGLVGFLKRIADHYPKTYVTLLAKILPMQIAATPQGEEGGPEIKVKYRHLKDLKSALIERGLPLPDLIEHEEAMARAMEDDERPMKVVPGRIIEKK